MIEDAPASQAHLRAAAAAQEMLVGELFDRIPVAMALSRRADGTFIRVNELFATQFGFTPEELVGRTSISVGLFDDVRHRGDVLRALERNGVVRNREVPMLRKDGTPVVVLSNILLVVIEGEGCLLTSNVDITDRKRLEREVRDGSEYRAAVLHVQSRLGQGITITENGRLIDANDAFCRITGRSPSELHTMDMMELLPPEEREAAAARLNKRRADDFQDEIFETRIVRPNGELVDVEVAAAVFHHQGARRTLALLRDITARRGTQPRSSLGRKRVDE